MLFALLGFENLQHLPKIIFNLSHCEGNTYRSGQDRRTWGWFGTSGRHPAPPPPSCWGSASSADDRTPNSWERSLCTPPIHHRTQPSVSPAHACSACQTPTHCSITCKNFNAVNPNITDICMHLLTYFSLFCWECRTAVQCHRTHSDLKLYCIGLQHGRDDSFRVG